MFLSANVLVRYEQCDRPLAEKISKTYKTVEAFLAASSEDIATTLNLTRNAEKGAIADAQDFLNKHFDL